MPTDKKITGLPIATSIEATDVSVLVDNNTDYQYSFTLLLEFLEANIATGANISFGTTLPQNTTGNNGDVFVNTSAGSFAQKLAGTWTIVYMLPAANGADGTILYGAGLPGSSTGKNSDTYINTLTGVFYQKNAGAWSQVFSMATGPQGPPGTPGTNGTNGTNGNTVLYGSSDPSNTLTGVNGNFYINTATYMLFGPKTSGAWGSGVSMIGVGVPGGGTPGQVLAKFDGTDYNTIWQDNSFAHLSGQPADNANLATALAAKQNTLGFTPENTANKAHPNGYASLDSSGKVPSAQLPAYVDEIQEFANLAAFPATGATGIIYIALDTNYEYRWSGSAYIQLVASPGSTDAVAEGTTNLYFTVARVLAVALSGITFGTVSVVTATDSILTAFGKLQAQLTALTGKVVPAGGTTGQVLAKNSVTDYDTTWVTPSGSSYTFSTGLTNTSGTVTVNSSQNIGTLNNLTSNGLVQTTGSSGALSILSTSATPAAATAPQWDANSNLLANSFIPGYATTTTAAGTTALTVSSAYQQVFTGTSTQTVYLPNVSTLTTGQPFYIVNNSTGVVTVQTYSAHTNVQALQPGTSAKFTFNGTTGTTPASWNVDYNAGATGSGSAIFNPTDTASSGGGSSNYAISVVPTFNTSGSAGTAAIYINISSSGFGSGANYVIWGGINSTTAFYVKTDGSALFNNSVTVNSGTLFTPAQYINGTTGLTLAFQGATSYGGIGMSTNNSSDVWAVGYNTSGPGAAFTGKAIQWNKSNQVIFGNTIQLFAFTVSTLPTATTGMEAYVTDASSPAIGSTVVGGGSSKAKVWYNGSTWTVTGV